MNNVYNIIGDKDYLMHHGIKGQKWGVENGPPYPLDPQKDYSDAEKKANAKLAKKVKNTWLKKSYNYKDTAKLIEASDQFKRALNNPKVKQAEKKLQKEEDIYHKFNHDDKLNDKYYTLAGIISSMHYGNINDIENVKNMIWGYKYEDFNQGYGTAFQLYCLDNKKNPDDSSNALDKYMDELQNAISDVMGEYGDIVIKDVKIGDTHYITDVKDIMTRINNQEHYAFDDPLTDDQKVQLANDLNNAKKWYNQHKNELE